MIPCHRVLFLCKNCKIFFERILVAPLVCKTVLLYRSPCPCPGKRRVNWTDWTTPATVRILTHHPQLSICPCTCRRRTLARESLTRNAKRRAQLRIFCRRRVHYGVGVIATERPVSTASLFVRCLIQFLAYADRNSHPFQQPRSEQSVSEWAVLSSTYYAIYISTLQWCRRLHYSASHNNFKGGHSKELLGPPWREQPQTSYIIMSRYQCQNKCIFSFRWNTVNNETDVITLHYIYI